MSDHIEVQEVQAINIGDYYNILNLVKAYNDTQDKKLRKLLYKLIEMEHVLHMSGFEEPLREIEVKRKRNEIKTV